MKNTINKIQQKIYAIFQLLMDCISNMRISSSVGGQFKKKQGQNENIPFGGVGMVRRIPIFCGDPDVIERQIKESKDDTMTPFSDALIMKKEIQGSVLHTFENVRHRLHRDKAKEIAEVIQGRMGA